MPPTDLFKKRPSRITKTTLYDLAVEALRIGEQLFGDESKSVAALTMNAALAFPSVVFTNRSRCRAANEKVGPSLSECVR